MILCKITTILFHEFQINVRKKTNDQNHWFSLTYNKHLNQL